MRRPAFRSIQGSKTCAFAMLAVFVFLNALAESSLAEGEAPPGNADQTLTDPAAVSPSAASSEATQRNAGSTLRLPGIDYKANFGARSLPLGAALTLEGGFGWPLYGPWHDPQSVLYGYVRPLLRVSSAGTINAADAGISIYPVSFVGLTVGKARTWRMRDESRNVDCWQYECGGTLQADFGTIDVLLAAGPIFLATQLDRRDLVPTGFEEDFYEDGAAIIGRKGYDRMFSHTHTLGWQLGDEWLEGLFVGVGGRRSEMHIAGTYSERASILAGHRMGPWRFAYVASLYRSHVQETAPAFGFSVDWIGEPGLSVSR